MPAGSARPSFYDTAFLTAEREAEAAAADGVDDEVGLLRAKIKERMSAGEGDVAALVKLMPLLLRAIGLRYRISPQRAQEFADHAAALMNSMREQFSAPDEP